LIVTLTKFASIYYPDPTVVTVQFSNRVMHDRYPRSSSCGLVTAVMRVVETSGTSGSAYRKNE
jgi:hypothetical protein